jgi:DNA mismatch repair protein MutS
MRDGSGRLAAGGGGPTVTALGARRLAEWLLAPLLDLDAIRARQDAVEELSTKAVWRRPGRGSCARSPTWSASSGASPPGSDAADLAGLGRSLTVLPDLATALQGCRAGLWKRLAGLSVGSNRSPRGSSAPCWTPPADLDDGGFIRPGYSEELDASSPWPPTAGARWSTSSGASVPAPASRASGSLYRVFGYFEVTRANLHLVPQGWERRQTMVGASASSPRS